jgi:hypothetical protein
LADRQKLRSDHLIFKCSTTSVDSESVHKFAFSREPVEDRPSKIRRRRPAAIAATLLVLAVRLALPLSDARVSRLLHPPPYPSCGTAAFEPPISQEGLCVVYEDSNFIVRNIVDRNSTLHMPEYDAHLITWRVTRTRVPNWREEPKLYPHGHGELVSLELKISNPGDEPLQYGPLIARSATPSYHPQPPAELMLPLPAGPGELPSFAAIFNARGAPGPSLFGQSPIQPRTSITGWISIVVPLNAGKLVGALHSGLQLSPSDGNPNYVGIFRLWNIKRNLVPR